MNHKLKIIIISNALFVLAYSMFIPVYSVFVAQIGGDVKTAGLLFGTHFLANGLTTLFVVRLHDHKKMFLEILKLNYLLRGAAVFLLAFFPSIETLIFVQVFGGIVEAFGTPAFNTLVTENLDNKKHLSEWGAWELLKNPAVAIGTGLSGFIVASFGFQTLFIIKGVTAFICLLVLMGYKKQPR